MTNQPLETVVRHLRRVTGPSLNAAPTDAELLERFVGEQDAAAFELLVWRHQRMVFGVCRRVLRDAADAEDAFQATFFALARKAGSMTPSAAWPSRPTARRSRSAATTRRSEFWTRPPGSNSARSRATTVL